METLSKSNRETKGEFNILKSDPVITYDHMSETARNKYYSMKQNITNSPMTRFLLEELLIAGLAIMALLICL